MMPETEQVNRVSLQNDIKAALYEIRRSNLSDVSLGNAFDALVRAGTRNGVRNPGEFVHLTRAVVILESMIRQLAPNHDYMQSFRDQFSRLAVKHLSVERVTDKGGKFTRDLMRLMSEGPGDTRRILRRLADGDLGRLPKIEALGERLDRNAERLSRAVTYGSLLISGSLLALTPHFGARQAGALMTAFGLGGMIISAIGALRRAYSR
jgi:ubiquinone biosynthesis protein